MIKTFSRIFCFSPPNVSLQTMGVTSSGHRSIPTVHLPHRFLSAWLWYRLRCRWPTCSDTWSIDRGGLATHSLFPLTAFIIWAGRLPGPWSLCSHEEWNTHALRHRGMLWDTHRPTLPLCLPQTHSSSQCENLGPLSSSESHRCSSWHLSRLWWGGSRGLF